MTSVHATMDTDDTASYVPRRQRVPSSSLECQVPSFDPQDCKVVSNLCDIVGEEKLQCTIADEATFLGNVIFNDGTCPTSPVGSVQMRPLSPISRSTSLSFPLFGDDEWFELFDSGSESLFSSALPCCNTGSWQAQGMRPSSDENNAASIGEADWKAKAEILEAKFETQEAEIAALKAALKAKDGSICDKGHSGDMVAGAKDEACDGLLSAFGTPISRSTSSSWQIQGSGTFSPATLKSLHENTSFLDCSGVDDSLPRLMANFCAEGQGVPLTPEQFQKQQNWVTKRKRVKYGTSFVYTTKSSVARNRPRKDGKFERTCRIKNESTPSKKAKRQRK